MTYFQTINNETLPIWIGKNQPTILVKICKDNYYQDSMLEEQAAYSLSSNAFVLYCLMSMRQRGYIWAYPIAKMPMSEDDAENAFDELVQLGHLEGTTHLLSDQYGEVVKLKGYNFYEQPIKSTRRD